MVKSFLSKLLVHLCWPKLSSVLSEKQILSYLLFHSGPRSPIKAWDLRSIQAKKQENRALKQSASAKESGRNYRNARQKPFQGTRLKHFHPHLVRFFPIFSLLRMTKYKVLWDVTLWHCCSISTYIGKNKGSKRGLFATMPYILIKYRFFIGICGSMKNLQHLWNLSTAQKVHYWKFYYILFS